MKSFFIRPAIVLGLSLSLAACGGGKASFDVGGKVSGLLYPGLVLTNAGVDLAVAPPADNSGNTSFKFPDSIEYGTAYAVAIKDTAGVLSQPAHQNCTVFNGADTAGRLTSIDVSVVCAMNAYPISGTVANLKAEGLVLINGSNGGQVAVVKASPAFSLGPVAYNVSYGISVLTQPAGQTCSVSANGTGTMLDAAVTGVVVTCTDNPA